MLRTRLVIVACLALAGVGCALSLTLPTMTAAVTVCPTLPTTLADLIAADVGEPHPLSDQYPRPLWDYTEHAADCFGDAQIVVDVVISSPEGLGGTSAFRIEPAWVIAERFVAADPATADPSDPDQFFPLAVPPALEDAFASLRGRAARISGHFNDSVAETCRVTEGEPPDAPPPDVAIEICATAFVLTSIRPIEGPPGTDAADPVPPALDAGLTRAPLWLVAVALATLVAAVLHLERRVR